MSEISGCRDPTDASCYDQIDFSILSTEFPFAQSTFIDENVRTCSNVTIEYPLNEEQVQASKRRRPFRPDQIKHRRTRNGCFTCRNRRVKCDERHPTCERCSKGKRECSYPERRTNPSSTAASTCDRLQKPATDINAPQSAEQEGARLDVEGRSAKSSMLLVSRNDRDPPALQDRGKNPSGCFTNLHSQSRYQDEDITFEQSLSPSPESPIALASASLEQQQKFSSTSRIASPETCAWSHLPADLQYYMEYHQKHITYHHYLFKYDADAFFSTTLIEQALQYDPLLYAIVGFTAFHEAVKRHVGKIQDFLGYYDKSVSLLRKSLASDQSYTNAKFLTTLHLALFEEYLGDYVSLLGHQQAAYRMLTELYTPESVMSTDLGRYGMDWYTRFELTSGLMSENVTSLGSEWFGAAEKWFREMCEQHPGRIDYKFRFAFAQNRILWADLASLYSKVARGPMTLELQQESDRCESRMNQWMAAMDASLKDKRFLVKDFDGRLADSADIVDPFVEIWREPLYTVNFMFLDWSAMSMLFKMKISQAMHRPPPPELERIALEACRVFETIEFWPESPAGSLLKAKSVLGMACLFLPKDDQHIMWCRRKLAKIESLGLVYPPAFRRQMANLWGLPEIKDQWWVPDEDSCPAVIRTIRSCLSDRLPQAATESRSEDQRNMKGIFSQSRLSNQSNET